MLSPFPAFSWPASLLDDREEDQEGDDGDYDHRPTVRMYHPCEMGFPAGDEKEGGSAHQHSTRQGQRGSREDPRPGQVDPAKTTFLVEAIFDGRPQERVGSLSEDFPIARQSCGVSFAKAFRFGGTSARRAVVKFAAEQIPAEVVPIGAGVTEVEVPDLVDFVRGGAEMARRGREEEESLVFPDGPQGKIVTPAVLCGKASREGEGGSGGVDLEVR